jgi:hypothetical protein
LENPGGAIGQNATATYFYRIFNSIDPINKPPFSTVNSSATPTAARGTIAGIVTSKSGRNLSKVEIVLVAGNGEVRKAITNPFGNYSFTDVPYGEFYVVQINSPKNNFISDARGFQFLDDMNEVNFVVQ